MSSIDLNADLGEGMPNDQEIMRVISSCNIACGFHAGDKVMMNKTVDLALECQVNIGAHPSFPDRFHFGRINKHFAPKEVFEIVVEQIEALNLVARRAGASLSHVKPHGALYNMASVSPELAYAIGEAVYSVDSRLMLFGMSQSCLTTAGSQLGLRVVHEAFADRAYLKAGELMPRSSPGAVFFHEDQALTQTLSILIDQVVYDVGGNRIPIKADTVCLHGDWYGAVTFARKIKGTLIQRGISILPPKAAFA